MLRLAGAGLWSLAPARAQIVACAVTPPTSRNTLPIARLLAEADAAGEIDWMVSVDSTINRAHQHATNAARVERPAGRRPVDATGG